MRIKLSKNQWEQIGKTAGWIKSAQQSIQISQGEIAKYVQRKNWQGLADYLYKTITTNVQKTDYLNKNWNDPSLKQWRDYYSKIADPHTGGSPGWAQWNVVKDPNKVKGKNFKFYYTISDESLPNFITKLDQLQQILLPIAQQNSTSLSFKIPSNFSGFIGQNDRFVVHFSNQNAQAAIQQAVGQWMQSNGIKTDQRTHSFGQDTEKESYGMRIASQIAQYAQQYFESGKYTPEQIIQWIVTYFPQQLKNIQ